MENAEMTQAMNEAESVPLQDWKNPPTVKDLKQDLLDSKSDHDAQVERVQEWLDNLNVEGKAKPPKKVGASSVQPKLIRKQAEWRYAALSEPFLSTPDVFQVEPITWEDKQGAIQNSLVLNNQFNTQIDKTTFIDEYVRTAVDEGTVIVKVSWDYEEEEVTELEPVYEFNQALDAFPMFQQMAQMKRENPTGFRFEVPDPLQKAFEYFEQTGIPTVPRQVDVKEVQVAKTVKNQPSVEICDFRNVVIDPSCKGNIKKAKFVIYSFATSLDQLKKEGRYQNLENINIEQNSILGSPDHASENTSNFNFNDEPRKQFVVYEYWGYWDIDSSGRTRPIVAAWVGNTMIRLEESPFPDNQLPFVSVQYLPVRRKTHGEPDGHLLTDNQAITGAVTRGMIDLLGKSANGQTGFRKGALDHVNRRKYEQGKDYEYNGQTNPEHAIHLHKYPEIPASAQFMLQLQNIDAEAMTGVQAFSQNGLNGNALGETATGIRGALDAASKREMGILRRLSGGLIEIARKFMAMNAEFLDEEEVIRITNDEFVNVRRDDLAGKFDLKLSISTAEEDNAKASELAFMLQTLGPNEDPGLRKMILTDIARLRKMPDLAKRLEDYEPEPDPMQQRLQELEMLKLETEIRVMFGKVSESEASAILDRTKAITEQAKAANLQSDTDTKNLNFVEQESGVTQERELEKQGAQARANMALEAVKANIQAQSDDRNDLKSFLAQKN